MIINSYVRKHPSKNSFIKVQSHYRNYAFLIPKWGRERKRHFEELELVKLGQKPLALQHPFENRKTEREYRRFVKQEGVKFKRMRGPFSHKMDFIYKDPAILKKIQKAETSIDVGEALGYPKKASKRRHEIIEKAQNEFKKPKFESSVEIGQMLGYMPEGMTDEEIENAIRKKEKILKVHYLD